MFYPVSLGRRFLRAHPFAGLALALVLAAPAVAQPPHPSSSAPSSSSSSSSAGNSTADYSTPPNLPPAAANELFAGVATSAQPAPPPRLPLAFNAFATDFQPPKNAPLRWLTVRAGYIELDQPPPSAGPQGAGVFTVASLPADLLDRVHFVEFASLIGAKSRYENVTMIDHDPHGLALPFALPMGRIVYFLARQNTENGIDFDFYYYDANSLQWTPSPVDYNLLLPQPVVTIQKQSLVVPSDRYIMMPASEHPGPPHPGSTARQVMLYGYVLLNFHLVEGPPTGNSALSTAPASRPAPSGDVLSAPPTNPGTPLMQSGSGSTPGGY